MQCAYGQFVFEFCSLWEAVHQNPLSVVLICQNSLPASAVNLKFRDCDVTFNIAIIALNLR